MLDSIGDQPWAFVWHYELWLQMTEIPPISRSRKFDTKYLEKSVKYNNKVNGSRIGNHLCAIDWHRDLWPWLTVNHPWSRSRVSLQVSQKRWDIWWWIQRISGRHYDWHYEWHYELWLRIIFTLPISRSLKSDIKYLKKVTDTMMWSTEVVEKTTCAFSISTVSFDLGWSVL